MGGTRQASAFENTEPVRGMLPPAVAASRDDIEVLKLSKEDIGAWADSEVPESWSGGEINTYKAKEVEMLADDLKHNVNEQDQHGLSALHWAVPQQSTVILLSCKLALYCRCWSDQRATMRGIAH